jgi:hypothetical protein
VLTPALLESAVAQTVGTAGAVNPQAQVGDRVLQVGSSIIFRERISTSASGSTQVMFVDKTTLSVGPNSSILIDEFVYNPNAGTGRMTVTLTKGAMRMVGGNVSHSEGANHQDAVGHDRRARGCGDRQARRNGWLPSHQSFWRAVGDRLPTTTRLGGECATLACMHRSLRKHNPARIWRVRKNGGRRPEHPGPGAARRDSGADPATHQQADTERGSDSPPTDSIVAVLVGNANANLVPAQVQSVQGQTASQTAGSTQVQPAQTQTLAQQSQQSAQQASQQGAVPQVPRPAFYALSIVPDAALGSGVPYLPAAFAVPGTYVVSDMLGYRRGGIDPASGRPQFASLTLQAGLSINGGRRLPNVDILRCLGRLHHARGWDPDLQWGV